MEEFADFQGFLQKCVEKAGNSAIFKVRIGVANLNNQVIPPPEWKARRQGYDKVDFVVKSKRTVSHTR